MRHAALILLLAAVAFLFPPHASSVGEGPWGHLWGATCQGNATTLGNTTICGTSPDLNFEQTDEPGGPDDDPEAYINSTCSHEDDCQMRFFVEAGGSYKMGIFIDGNAANDWITYIGDPVGGSYMAVDESGSLYAGGQGGSIERVVVTTGDTDTPTTGEHKNTMHVADNATATDDTDYTLREISTIGIGARVCFYDNGGGDGGVIVDAAAGDDILLYGASNGAANAIDSPGVAGAGANGDYICLLAIDANTWVTLDFSGTWVGGGAD